MGLNSFTSKRTSEFRLELAVDFETTTASFSVSKSYIYVNTCYLFREFNQVKDIKQSFIDPNPTREKSFEDHLITKMLEWCCKRCKYQKSKVIWWFNNSSRFDGEYIKHYLLTYGFKQQLPYVRQKGLGNRTFEIIEVGVGGDIKIVIRYKGLMVMIKDLSKICLMSVKNMGECLNLPKLEMEYDLDPTKLSDKEWSKVIEYAERDVEIVGKYLVLFEKENNFRIDFKILTTASLAYNDYIKYANDILWMKESCFKIPIYEWNDQHYQGGYTNYNVKYLGIPVNNRKVYKFDINSSYPASMSNPVAFRLIRHESYNHQDIATLYQIKIKSAIIKPNGVRVIKEREGDEFNSHYVDKVYNETRWIWAEELKYWKIFYELDYEVIKELKFEKKDLFSEWISSKYRQRLNLKKTNQTTNLASNQVKATLMKLLMNSLYGKFGEKPNKELVYYSDIEYNVGEIIPFGPENDYMINRKTGFKYGERLTNKYYLKNLKSKKTARNNYIASWITMISRTRLYDAIIDVGVDNWLYSDTDSIICLEKLSENMVDNEKLGAWKHEGTWNHCVIGKQKHYLLSNTDLISKDSVITISGVNNYDNLYGLKISEYQIDNQLYWKTSAKRVSGGKLIEKKQIRISKKVDK